MCFVYPGLEFWCCPQRCPQLRSRGDPSGRAGVRGEPLGVAGFVEFTGGQCQGANDRVGFRGKESSLIHLKEQDGRSEAGAFVAVNEGGGVFTIPNA